MIGIYQSTNLINGKKYIGQSDNIEKRWEKHRIAPFNSNAPQYNCVFYRAIRKYGIENFKFEIIEECPLHLLNERERYWIKKYRTYLGFKDCNGYNMTLGGDASKALVLLEYEQVEKIQQLLLTTTMSQAEIGKQFNVSQMTISVINRGVTWVNEELTYPLRKRTYKTNNLTATTKQCPICGNSMDIKSKKCFNCYNKNRKEVPVSKEELNQLLLDNNGSFTKVSKLFNISDNGLRKWCKKLDLPTHSSDYKPVKVSKKELSMPKMVVMIDKNTGEEIKEFESISQAAQFLNTNGLSHISDAAKGKRKTAYGYKWKFKD